MAGFEKAPCLHRWSVGNQPLKYVPASNIRVACAWRTLEIWGINRREMRSGKFTRRYRLRKTTSAKPRNCGQNSAVTKPRKRLSEKVLTVRPFRPARSILP